MKQLPASVSLYLKLRDKPAGHRFSSKMPQGERLILYQWIRTGQISPRGRGYVIVERIEPIMHTQKIHNYISSHTTFTSADVSEAVGCSPQTTRKYLQYYADCYNLKTETTEHGNIYRKKS